VAYTLAGTGFERGAAAESIAAQRVSECAGRRPINVVGWNRRADAAKSGQVGSTYT